MKRKECLEILKELSETKFAHTAVVFYFDKDAEKVERRCIAASKIECIMWINSIIIEFAGHNIPYIAFLDSAVRVDCDYGKVIIDD